MNAEVHWAHSEWAICQFRCAGFDSPPRQQPQRTLTGRGQPRFVRMALTRIRASATHRRASSSTPIRPPAASDRELRSTSLSQHQVLVAFGIRGLVHGCRCACGISGLHADVAVKIQARLGIPIGGAAASGSANATNPVSLFELGNSKKPDPARAPALALLAATIRNAGGPRSSPDARMIRGFFWRFLYVAALTEGNLEHHATSLLSFALPQSDGLKQLCCHNLSTWVRVRFRT